MSVQSSFRNQKWWKEAIVYQVYPASFKDENGDGWGDVRGITSKLDYLKELGVDVVWTSPIYKSPQADMGYDIADYEDIDPRYGTLHDVDVLIAELKKRGMKLVMDLVVNHTSDEHEWFHESRSSLQNPKRDWYIWKKPRFDQNGQRQPPNNWGALLGEEFPAWTWDETTGEYYFSLFSSQQPDLNWENPEVREAVLNILRFWLDRGVSGFRMDVINLISKDQEFPDCPIFDPRMPYQPAHQFYANGPRLHEFLKEINQKVLRHYDTLTVGEMPYVRDTSEILKIVGAQREELNMIFMFELVDVDNQPGGFRMTLRDWDPREIKEIVTRHQRLMIENDGWNSVFCENHDQPRSVSRYTDDSDQNRGLGAKLLSLMQTTLGGTLYVYQGEELSMRNFPEDWPLEEYKDVESLNFWNRETSLYANDPKKLSQSHNVLWRKARDHSRTPIQWTAEPHGGFCTPDVTPWMRVNDDYKTVNAAAQLEDDQSVFHFWRRAIEMRKAEKDIFVYGDYKLLDEPQRQGDGSKIFAYLRASEAGDARIVALNFYGEKVEWEVPESVHVKEWLVGNYTGSAGKPEKATKGRIVLEPWEGLLGICG